MGQIQVNILGTSFKLQADEDTQFLTKLLDYYEKIVNKVSQVDSAKNNLQISIVSGLLLCEELFKEKANKLVSCINTFVSEKGIKYTPTIEEKKESERKELMPNNLFGTYEEIYSNWKNKMMHAVTINSRYLSFVTMCSCQDFYDEMFKNFQIPKIELIDYYNPDDLDAWKDLNDGETYVYTGDNVLEDEKSIAYALTFNDPTKTLTDEEVMELFNKIISEVETKCNAKLRMN